MDEMCMDALCALLSVMLGADARLSHSHSGVAAHGDRPVVVAAPAAYHTALEPWVERRRGQGYDVRVIDTSALLRTADRSQAAGLLSEAIAQQLESAAIGEPASGEAVPVAGAGAAGFVLIVGDAPGPDESLDATRFVPAGIELSKARPGLGRAFASDNVYGLPDARGVPRVAVGRWPVRSPEEVAVQAAKSLRYESEQSPGLHRGTVTFLATTPNYEPVVDVMLERTAMSMIGAQLKPHWRMRALYSSPRSPFFPGPRETPEQVRRWLEDATPMTLFAGHGYDCGVDAVRYEDQLYPVLDSDRAERVRSTRPGTVLWMSACCCGDFDLPGGRRGLAESLVMNEHGPTAVIAGSDETSAYVNLLHCLGLARTVLEQPPETLGDALLRFKRAAYRPGPSFFRKLLLSMEPAERPDRLADDHQYLYNLLGDATLALRLPARVAVTAEFNEQPSCEPGQKRFTVCGRLDDWDAGVAEIALVVDRLALKEHSPDPATLDQPDERERAYLDRFAKANDKVVAAGETVVRDGCFELELTVPESLAPRVRWLQVYVHTNPRSDGSWRDAIAAQSVKLMPDAADLEPPTASNGSSKSLRSPVIFDGNVVRKIW
jgi:hypothetical protein